MECVPCRTALEEMVREEEKLTGGFGPFLSETGRVEPRLLDIVRELACFGAKLETRSSWISQAKAGGQREMLGAASGECLRLENAGLTVLLGKGSPCSKIWCVGAAAGNKIAEP